MVSLDDTGTEFPNLDAAYLDAFRAAGEIWHEMASHGQDCSDHSFEITDFSGKALIEIPFSEVFQTGPRTRPAAPKDRRTRVAHDATTKSRVLAGEIANLVATAQKTIAQTQLVLQRSRALAL